MVEVPPRKREHELDAQLQGSPDNGVETEEEVVEPTRTCETSKNDMTGIDARSKTHVAA